MNKTPATIKTTLLACMIGNAIEWYDFTVYGYFAMIIGKLFFPESSPILSLIASYAVFAAGFIMRPLGGIFFGHIGDKYGRKKALLLSIYLMVIPTALISILPTYAMIGWVAPLILIVIRMLQGLSVGGELTGAMVLIFETSPDNKKGFYGSWIVCSVVIGMLFGTITATTIFYFLSADQLVSWGWRLPFVLSIFGAIIGIYMRRKLRETETFSNLVSKNMNLALPIVEVFKSNLPVFIVIFGIELTLAVGFYIGTVFLPTYLTIFIGWEPKIAGAMNTISTLIMGLSVPIVGYFSDFYSKRKIIICATLGYIFLSVPIFYTFDLESGFTLVLVSQCLLALLMSLFYAPLPAMICEAFPSQVRYSSISIVHSLCMALAGGTTPLFSTWLIEKTDVTAAPGYYLSFIACITLISLMIFKRFAHHR